jgi:hypothetical protein
VDLNYVRDNTLAILDELVGQPSGAEQGVGLRDERYRFRIEV